MHRVSKKTFYKPLSEKVNTFEPQSKNLASISLKFKSAVNIHAMSFKSGLHDTRGSKTRIEKNLTSNCFCPNFVSLHF
jgi:hypothetical protein